MDHCHSETCNKEVPADFSEAMAEGWVIVGKHWLCYRCSRESKFSDQ